MTDRRSKSIADSLSAVHVVPTEFGKRMGEGEEGMKSCVLTLEDQSSGVVSLQVFQYKFFYILLLQFGSD